LIETLTIRDETQAQRKKEGGGPLNYTNQRHIGWRAQEGDGELVVSFGHSKNDHAQPNLTDFKGDTEVLSRREGPVLRRKISVSIQSAAPRRFMI